MVVEPDQYREFRAKGKSSRCDEPSPFLVITHCGIDYYIQWIANPGKRNRELTELTELSFDSTTNGRVRLASLQPVVAVAPKRYALPEVRLSGR